MEGILIAIISGLFSLAGIWLNNYLKKEKSAKLMPQRAESDLEATRTAIPAKQKVPQRGIPPKEKSEKVVFFRMPSWWLVMTAVMTVSICAAFFARWIIEYGLDVFNVASPDVGFSWLVLGLGGIAWGLAYVIMGTVDADNVTECLFVLFGPYDDLFGAIDLSDFLRGLLSALPINFIVSWGTALGVGVLATTQLGANLSGVVHLGFGVICFIGIVWFVLD